MIWENLKMASRSITGNKIRTALTMLGIIIGVSSVSLVIAIGNGVKAAVTDQVSELGTNILQVNPGSGGGEGGGFDFASALGSSTLTEKDVDTIKRIDGVEAAAPFMFVSGVVTGNGKPAAGSMLIATTPELSRALKLDIVKGRFINGGTAKEVVLGGTSASKLFGDDALGKKVTIRNQPYTVVGVTKKPDADAMPMGPGVDSMIFMPFEVGKGINNNSAAISEIDVRTDPNRVDEVKSEIKKRLEQNHGGQKDFTVMDAKEALKIFDQILAILTSFVAAIASISLLVGGIGIMNIMLVSVTERTREIGLRKALGATSGMVLNQFLIEAMVLTLLGGGLGLAFAWLAGVLVKSLTKIEAVFTLEAVLTAFLISTLVGIVFGIAPAIKAARMKPIEALRYE